MSTNGTVGRCADPVDVVESGIAERPTGVRHPHNHGLRSEKDSNLRGTIGPARRLVSRRRDSFFPEAHVTVQPDVRVDFAREVASALARDPDEPGSSRLAAALATEPAACSGVVRQRHWEDELIAAVKSHLGVDHLTRKLIRPLAYTDEFHAIADALGVSRRIAWVALVTSTDETGGAA